MPSSLRRSSPLAAPVDAVYSSGSTAIYRPAAAAKKQTMSITQTYFLAHQARGKLSSEAARGDHDLRLLVGHANLLDSLMLELQDAERQQESWFNDAVSKQSSEESRRTTFIDPVIESISEDDESDSDSDADDYDSEDEQQLTPASRSKSPAPMFRFSAQEVDEEDDDMATDDEDDMDGLALVRTSSHSHPPELVSDDSSDEEMEDITSPRSPPADLQIHGIKSHDFAGAKKGIHQQSTPLVAAY